MALTTLVVAAVPVGVAWLTKLLLDRLTEEEPSWAKVGPLMPGLMIAAIVTAVAPHAYRYLIAEFGRRTALEAQDTLYQRINGTMGLRRFEDPGFLDRLRIAQHSGQQAPAAIASGSLSLVQIVLTATGFFLSLLVIQPAMAWIVLVSAVPALVGEFRLARARFGAALSTTPFERREFFYATLLADVQAAKEVRLFGLGDFLRGRMLADRRSIDAIHRQVDRRTVSIQGGLAALSAAVIAGGLLWSVWMATQGVLTVGDISMFVASVAAVQSGLGHLAHAVARLHQDLLIFGHYDGVTEAGPDLREAALPRSLPALRRGIELRDVWFRYADDHPWVLRGVTLTIPFGQAVGLVGANGAGKSTLVKLLCRFYDPGRGSILWDGIDLRDVPVAQLRERTSAIFQDFMQYEMTATDNIAVGDLALAGEAANQRAAIEHAAFRAGIHGKLQTLPRGYETMLSRSFADPDQTDSGVLLSGGQWQRIALARALLRDQRDLLILDEPSSGLDAAAEYEIHTQLREQRAGRTSLLISHRLGAMRSADTIVVLDAGEVAEIGKHDELIAADGQYARLFGLQAEGYQPVGAP